MIKIDRNPVPPASLAIEAAKARGSYREKDVIHQLKEDSGDKCYLCELQELSDPQVEHLLPHHNYKFKERVFDWNNLFYACPHCNNLKNEKKYEEKILNCCVVDPEEVLEHMFWDGHVEIHNKIETEEVIMTADLIQNCFEKASTGIREAGSQYRIKKLSETMNVLYRTLKQYKDNPGQERYQKSLRGMLNRKSKFAAFKRYYVRQHLEDYPELREYV